MNAVIVFPLLEALIRSDLVRSRCTDIRPVGFSSFVADGSQR